MATTLDIQGVRVRLGSDDPHLARLLAEVVDYFGLPVADTGGAEAHAVLQLAAWEALPAGTASFRHVAHYGEHVEVLRSEDTFLLRSRHARIEVDPAAGRARGGVVNAHDNALRPEFLADVVLTVFMLLRSHGFVPLHAAALAHDGDGVLLAASSDAGKSTTAFNLVRQGWQFLSDDSVLLRVQREAVEAIAFRRNFGLDPDAEDRFPEIAAHWSAQLTDVDKRCIAMDALFPGQSAEQCTPRLLLFPELTGESESVLTPLSKADALLKLIAQSALVSLSPAWTSSHLALLKALVVQAPSFRLLAGHDLLERPARIAELIRSVRTIA